MNRYCYSTCLPVTLPFQLWAIVNQPRWSHFIRVACDLWAQVWSVNSVSWQDRHLAKQFRCYLGFLHPLPECLSSNPCFWSDFLHMRSLEGSRYWFMWAMQVEFWALGFRLAKGSYWGPLGEGTRGWELIFSRSLPFPGPDLSPTPHQLPFKNRENKQICLQNTLFLEKEHFKLWAILYTLSRYQILIRRIIGTLIKEKEQLWQHMSSAVWLCLGLHDRTSF